jgi:hypothetical protein
MTAELFVLLALWAAAGGFVMGWQSCALARRYKEGTRKQWNRRRA